jgi:Flp pilus assembly pilin Flp
MKMLKNLRNRLRKNIANNQNGQGATEYILLLTVVVALVVMFGPKIKKTFSDKLGEVTGAMESVNTGEN